MPRSAAVRYREWMYQRSSTDDNHMKCSINQWHQWRAIDVAELVAGMGFAFASVSPCSAISMLKVKRGWQDQLQDLRSLTSTAVSDG